MKRDVVVRRRTLFEKPEANWTSDHSLGVGFLVEIVDLVKPETIVGELGKTDEVLDRAALVGGLLLLATSRGVHPHEVRPIRLPKSVHHGADDNAAGGISDVLIEIFVWSKISVLVHDIYNVVTFGVIQADQEIIPFEQNDLVRCIHDIVYLGVDMLLQIVDKIDGTIVELFQETGYCNIEVGLHITALARTHIELGESNSLRT